MRQFHRRLGRDPKSEFHSATKALPYKAQSTNRALANMKSESCNTISAFFGLMHELISEVQVCRDLIPAGWVEGLQTRQAVSEHGISAALCLKLLTTNSL